MESKEQVNGSYAKIATKTSKAVLRLNHARFPAELRQSSLTDINRDGDFHL